METYRTHTYCVSPYCCRQLRRDAFLVRQGAIIQTNENVPYSYVLRFSILLSSTTPRRVSRHTGHNNTDEWKRTVLIRTALLHIVVVVNYAVTHFSLDRAQ